MKRVLALTTLVVILFVFLVPFSSFAEGESSRPHIVDNAGLFTEQQKENINKKIEEHIEKFGYDFLLLTENESNTEIETNYYYREEAYAAEYFDSHGNAPNGGSGTVLMLYVYDNGNHYVNCLAGFGKCENELTGSVIDDSLDIVDRYVKNRNYESAAIEFLEHIDAVYSHKVTFGQIIVYLAIAFLIGLIPASIRISNLKRQMVVKTDMYAANYLVNGSFRVRNRRDTFLYKTLSRTPRNTERSSSGGHSGHTSSGRSYSGGSHRG